MNVDGEGCAACYGSFWRSHYLDMKCSYRRRIARGGNEVSVGPPEFAVSVGRVVSLEWKCRTRVQETGGAGARIY